MRYIPLTLFCFLTLGCLADPTDYPYNGPLGSAGQRDGGAASGDASLTADAGPRDTGQEDTGPTDAGVMDTGPDLVDTATADSTSTDVTMMDMGLPPMPDRIRCVPDDATCEPVRCEGACEVDCSRPGTRCSVDCDTDERCDLKCSPNTELCEMSGCAAPVQCGRNWVCNGECVN